jgi:hypothetical protein
MRSWIASEQEDTILEDMFYLFGVGFDITRRIRVSWRT